MKKETPKFSLYSENALLKALNRKKKLRENLINKISIYDLGIREIQDELRKRSCVVHEIDNQKP